MALYIFSDAHLGSGPDELEEKKVTAIRRLFEMVMVDGDRLVVLGDLFDFWFEYKYAIPKVHYQVLCMMMDVGRHGVAIDYVSGNHDFWMDDFFEKHVGVTVHRDYLDMAYQGKRLHLIHGDGLAPGDGGYRFLKRILRNRLNIWLYRKLPPDWALPLARKVSGSSRSYTSQRDHEFAKDYEVYARGKVAEGYDVVAIGHLHIPVKQQMEGGVYINTGDFISHFSYVKITESEVRLEYLEI